MNRIKDILTTLIEITQDLGITGITSDCMLEQAVKIYLSEKIQESKKENIKEMKQDNKPTEKQIALLKKFKVNPNGLTRLEATNILKEKLNKDY